MKRTGLRTKRPYNEASTLCEELLEMKLESQFVLIEFFTYVTFDTFQCHLCVNVHSFNIMVVITVLHNYSSYCTIYNAYIQSNINNARLPRYIRQFLRTI